MSTGDHSLPVELGALLAALREGTLDTAQAARLEQLVCENPAARRAYIEYQHMVADLRWLCGGGPPSLPTSPPKIASPAVDVTTGWRGWIQGLPWIDAAPVIIFGTLMLAIGMLVGMRLEDSQQATSPATNVAADVREAPPADNVDASATDNAPVPPISAPTVATLTATVDCRWESGTLPTHAGAKLAPGTLRLTAGVAQIDFDSGARVLLEGPAVFEVTTAKAGLLSIGQLVARVPPAAVGFTIRTPSAVVVDLGTEFGVIAEPQGATEVQVFDGTVELGVPAVEERPILPSVPLILTAGQARRLDAPAQDEVAAAIWTERPFEADRFTREIKPSQEPILGDLLLTDDFTGDKLDRGRWRVITEGIRSPEAKILVADGHVELSNRAHLVTREEYDPARLGGLRIRGRWTFTSDIDTMQILTRSDGVPNASANGDTQNGVEFIASTDQGGVIGIYGRGDAQLQFGIALLPIQIGDTFDFEIVDDGTNVSFTMTEVGGERATATVSTRCEVDLPTDFVVFHNRERGRKPRTAQLERVTLEGNLRPNPDLPAAAARP